MRAQSDIPHPHLYSLSLLSLKPLSDKNSFWERDWGIEGGGEGAWLELSGALMSKSSSPPLPFHRNRPTLPSQNDHGNFFSSGILLPIGVRTLSSKLYQSGRIVFHKSSILVMGEKRWQTRQSCWIDDDFCLAKLLFDPHKMEKTSVTKNVEDVRRECDSVLMTLSQDKC